MADNKTSSSDSGSDPAGVDITQTEVHRSPYREAGSDDDVSVQSDFAAGVDISYQAAFPGDIDAFLNRRDQEDSDESRDMEIPSRKPSSQGVDINLTPTGVTREPRAARPKAKAESRPAKTPKNAAKARGSIGRQVREGRSKWDDPSPPPAPAAGLEPTTQAPLPSQDRSQMAGALGELDSPSSAGYPAAPSNPAPSLPRRFRKSKASRQEPSDKQPPSTLQTQVATSDSPRFAWDARLSGSSQHLETEHGIEKDAIGGAMSVKLVSWTDPLKLTPVPCGSGGEKC